MVNALQLRYNLLQNRYLRRAKKTLAQIARDLGISNARLNRAWRKAYNKAANSFDASKLRDINWKRGRPHKPLRAFATIEWITSAETLKAQAGMSIKERAWAITRSGTPMKPHQLRLIYYGLKITN
jgi:hypothetical protein